MAGQVQFSSPKPDEARLLLGGKAILTVHGKGLGDGEGFQGYQEPATDVYLGYPHGPKTSEYVPAGRQRETATAHFAIPLHGSVVASLDSFACSSRGDVPLGSTFGPAESGLYDSIYDRGGDWLLTFDVPPHIKPLGQGKFQIFTDSACHVSVKPHYYRDHLGYFLWSKTDALWRKPVAGWCSWAAYGQDVNEGEVRDASVFFSDKLKAYGYNVIQIDDGYQRVLQNRDSSGKLPELFARYWTVPNSKFSSGLASLADSISGLGMTPGIWVGYYLPLGLKHVEGYTTDPSGKPHKGPWVGYAMNGLDAEAREEAYTETVRELHAMGWRYFKIDTLRHILYDNYRKVPAYWKGRKQSMEEAYRKILEDTKKAIGDSYLLACWGTLPELAGIPNGCRIGEDVGPDFDSMRRTAKYIAQFDYLNNVIWRNDPDYMCFRVPLAQAQAWATMNFLAGGQVMVSDPLSAYDEPRVDALRRIGPPVLTRPLSVVSHGPDPEFMLLNAAKGGAYWTVAARFGWETAPAKTVPLTTFGLHSGVRYLAFDFWNSRFIGVVTDDASFDAINQGACQVICFRPLEDHPQVLGDDRHLSQGAYELEGVTWAGVELSGSLNLGPGRAWNLYVHVPEGWKVEKASEGLATKQDGEVLTLTFPNGSGPMKWEVSFSH